MRLVLPLLLVACGRINFDANVDADGRLHYRDAVMADRPVAYWRLDDTGATARDELGARPGTYSGDCTQLVAGALADDPSPAVHFGDAICRVDTSAVNFNGVASFTVEVWVLLEATDDYHVFFMNETRQGAGPLDGYAMLATPFGTFIERSSQAVNNGTDLYTPTLGVFGHYVGTYDGSALRMFIDGSEFGMPQPDNRSIDSTGAAGVIGAYPLGFGPPHFVGVLDELAIYDHVLPAERIALHHDIGRTGPR